MAFDLLMKNGYFLKWGEPYDEQAGKGRFGSVNLRFLIDIRVRVHP